jgi:hypothetical protein
MTVAIKMEAPIEVEAEPAILQRVSLMEGELLKSMRRLSCRKEELSSGDTFGRADPCDNDTCNPTLIHPDQWPQAPMMLQPTLGSNTKIKGIRHADSSTYQTREGLRNGVLPINCGKEKSGKSLVIDFETEHFVGTVLFRIRDIPVPTNTPDHYQQRSYFDGKKRRFQAIVRGRFKTSLRISECVTGQCFDRPAGPLPARYLVHSFLRLVSTLAPQLEAHLDSDQPRFLSPLAATAHTVLVNDTTGIGSQHQNKNSHKKRQSTHHPMPMSALDMEAEVEEPSPSDPTSIIRHLDTPNKENISSVSSRMKLRKKLFNKVSATENSHVTFCTNKEYTFEFYQHMLHFTDPSDLHLDLGLLGKIGLSQSLDGQPIKFMAAHKCPKTGELFPLWSFDLWHRSLYDRSIAH